MPYTNVPLDVQLDLGNGEQDQNDYRPVPSSDRGNDGYHDRGMLGFYRTNDGKPFEPVDGVQYFDGYGASMEDIKRGWSDPLITEHPAYTETNYRERYSQPKEAEVIAGTIEATPSEWEFRDRQRRTKGFLTRPRVPYERA